MKGSTISDNELATWAAIERADEAYSYNWIRHGWGAPVIVTALAPEALEMRRILRAFIARHEETTTDPLVLRAVELLGFNQVFCLAHDKMMTEAYAAEIRTCMRLSG